VESLHRRPLILVGRGWQSILDRFFDEFHTYLPSSQRELLYFAKDVHTAVKMLDQ
jgi:hypothetical protein